MDQLEKFSQFLKDPSPAFICRAAGRAEPKPQPIKINVTHSLGAPANEADLKVLLPHAPEDLLDYYKRYNGLSLFSAHSIIGQVVPALKFFSTTEVPENTRTLRKPAGLLSWIKTPFMKHGLAFGEIPCSGNLFVIHNKKIYYSNHDGGSNNVFSSSFSAMLNEIITDPAKFLMRAGCYTRYSDGVTKNQWIPDRYISSS